MRVSVIIPCKNEAGVVEQLLDSLTLQTTQPYEVIVVDSHSTDTTVKSVKQYKNKLPLIIHKARTEGVAAARNEGAAHASGDLLFFIDADASLPPGCVAQLTAQVAKRGLEVGGFSQRMATNRLGLRLGARIMNGYVRLMALTPWPIFFSCYFATKKIHHAIHGFDEEAWILEDYDYAYRAARHGAYFGIIHGTFFYASARRFKADSGRDIWRAVYAEFYRYTHGMKAIKKPLYTYQMGNHTNAATSSGKSRHTGVKSHH